MEYNSCIEGHKLDKQRYSSMKLGSMLYLQGDEGSNKSIVWDMLRTGTAVIPPNFNILCKPNMKHHHKPNEEEDYRRNIHIITHKSLRLNISHHNTCKAKHGISEACSSSCAGHKISDPFRLKHDPHHCGDERYELACEDNQLVQYLQNGKYNVVNIDYNNFTIRLRDANIIPDFNYSSLSLPPYSLSDYNFTQTDTYSILSIKRSVNDGDMLVQPLTEPIILVRCEHPVHSSLYVDTAPCITRTNPFYFYVLAGTGYLPDLGLRGDCRIELLYMTSSPLHTNASCTHIHRLLLYGFDLSWFDFNYTFCPLTTFHSLHNLLVPHCRTTYMRPAFLSIGLFTAAKSIVVGTPLVLALLIYKWRRRHLSMYDNIEDFLQSDNNIMPIRYSYKDIKKMTRGFKIKLGKGGYGSVFRGQLRSGRIVAIKMLDKAKTGGQDFINEVATLGRIHHVNVVHLIGYCVEASKHALIYEFMENGSLDKYIHSQQDHSSLNIEKLYAISLGIARGIKYLHNGCDMQILHFDIKPHNILLDDNFNPKVSDFGLARLYSTDDSIVSLTAARGTIGYMAPELFYKNVGGVSYKADVYSFGMLLMEMASRRKSFSTLAEHSSQHYLPFWVYDQLNEGKEINVINATEEEMKLAKKMMIVALWCIQTKPSDRPSMNSVVEMLERDNEDLQLPGEPCLYSNDLPETEVEDATCSTCLLSSAASASDSKYSVATILAQESRG
ncbi:rust resistance kinase Lr10-like [Senna tora]|uniref:Rust resistance kinase Lr10-like n=1 Tax=Senna tora TaxID=362788 RepID=A0A834WH00_9FABA|nr:rust resistance kinase Lr10-like [Senna tora]